MFNHQRDNVDKLTSLRLRYLQLILKESVSTLLGVSQQGRQLVDELAALKEDHETFLCLCTCDLLMSSSDWALTWGPLLSEFSDVQSMCTSMLNKFGLDKQSLLVSKTMPVDPPSAKGTVDGKQTTHVPPGEDEHTRAEHGSIFSLLLYVKSVFFYCFHMSNF